MIVVISRLSWPSKSSIIAPHFVLKDLTLLLQPHPLWMHRLFQIFKNFNLSLLKRLPQHICCVEISFFFTYIFFVLYLHTITLNILEKLTLLCAMSFSTSNEAFSSSWLLMLMMFPLCSSLLRLYYLICPQWPDLLLLSLCRSHPSIFDLTVTFHIRCDRVSRSINKFLTLLAIFLIAILVLAR